ncbi:ABC transporter ATP-binding protein [uncultured Sneathiella sp.]|uniref:ABC transporter ATP-binding protein n=1 Tax=uncultured Sneathiella sp. TaxID=879315 RepID=UPI0030EDE5E9|tara:strand:+ start:50681 stop:51757 length:1077 start_codon:yes stop_codon:yes gene_type:complete
MVLELKQVSKTVGGETHIYPTDMVLEAGEFNILLGTTISGKTSLMQLMAGLDRPTSGQVWFNGLDVTEMPVQKRNVSMVYQQFINYPNMTVFENIASPLRVAKLPDKKMRSRVGEIAEILRISSMLERRPSELSGGQQQRVAIARALVKDSSLILFDEPLANLDFKLREELRDELPRLFAERDCVVVYATTEPSEALLFGGKCAAMFEGAVAQFGPTAELYRKPLNLTSAQVFSEPPLNVAKVVKSGNIFRLSDTASWPVDAGYQTMADGEYTIGVRPHHVYPMQKEKQLVPIVGKVQVAELSGSESMIHFTAFDDDSWVSLSHGVHAFDGGEVTTFYVDVANCFYFGTDGRLISAGM